MFVAPRNRRHQRALANLAIAFPEKTEAERDRIARAMWGNLGRVMAGRCRLIASCANRRLQILNEPMFNRYKDKMGQPSACH